MLQDFTDDNNIGSGYGLVPSGVEQAITLTNVDQDLFPHIHSADQMLIALSQIHTEIFELQGTVSLNTITFRKQKC